MINRRNFLALIPSLSAIPFIGKEIIQEPDKVTIIKPEPVKIENPSLTSFDMSKCRVKLMYEGQEIGEGYLTHMSINSPLDVSLRDSDGYSQYSIGLRSVEISAELYNFHL